MDQDFSASNRSYKKIKICHLTSAHPAFDNRIFHKECKTLLEDGYEVHLIARHERNEIRGGIFVHALPPGPFKRMTRMTKIVWKLYQIAKSINAKVYHFHDPEIIPVGLLLKIKGKKVIYDTHEDSTSAIKSKPWINPHLRNIVAVLFYFYEQIAVRFFDAVISGHPVATMNIRKSVPLYNYPDLNLFPMTQTKGSTNSKFLWLGLLSEGRGATKIREAIKKNRDLVLDVIGPTEDISWVQERMNFLGAFPVEEAFQMAKGYVAGLVTYLPEPNNINSSPNKMFEYMALGIPVIASNFLSWRRIIEDGNCGICVNPKDCDEIANAMVFLLKNQNKAEKMGRNGRYLVENKYNWEIECKALLEVYCKFV
jgi:glycosyltransferase involved in cell wall biosynthesis